MKPNISGADIALWLIIYAAVKEGIRVRIRLGKKTLFGTTTGNQKKASVEVKVDGEGKKYFHKKLLRFFF